MEFTTTLQLDGKTATGIRVPDEVVAALGGGKRIPVSVTINGTRYASTIATMRGEPKIPVSADIRAAAGITAGDSIVVELERDDATRTVDVPADLADALRADSAASVRFAALSYSNQRRHVLSITGARTTETRARRIQRVLDELRTSWQPAELLASGAVHVTTDLTPSLFGFHAAACLWLTVTPGDLHQIGQALSLHPETTFTAAITGTANLLVTVACHDLAAFYAFVTAKVGTLPAVRQAEIVPVLHRLKQAGTRVRDGRLTATWHGNQRGVGSSAV